MAARFHVDDLNSIVAIGGSVVVSMSEFTACGAVLAKFVGGSDILDTTADIENALPALLADSSLGGGLFVDLSSKGAVAKSVGAA